MKDFGENLKNSDTNSSSNTSSDATENPNVSKLSNNLQTFESNSGIINGALATSASTTIDGHTAMESSLFSSSSSLFSPISQNGSMHMLDLNNTNNSPIRGLDMSSNNDLQTSLSTQSMQSTHLIDNEASYPFTCYLHDTSFRYEFANHAFVAKAKPCQFLRRHELQFVQCVQSFLYIVCRSDPSDIAIQFFKVRT
jgi:hypothetical protein